MLWHQRLGHIEKKGLRILHGNGMVEGIPNLSLDFDFYEWCVYGKQNQVIFPFGGKRAKEILELVCIVTCLELCQFHHGVSLCTVYHLYMTSQEIHGYMSLGINLKSLRGLKNLRLWSKTR